MTRTALLLGAILLASSSALAEPAQRIDEPAQRVDEPALAAAPKTFGDWRIDAPGVAHKITVPDLPAPLASEPKASRSVVTPRPEGAELKTLPGFTATLVASGLTEPRVIRFAPDGDLFLSESSGGRVRVLRFAPGQTAPVRNEVFAAGLDRPYGIAFYPPGPDPRYVYVATHGAVLRYPYENGALRPSGPVEDIARLPAGAGHWTRDLAFSPDGATLYVAIGSQSNVAEGQKPFARAEIEALEKSEALGASAGAEQGRALVAAFDPDGKNRRVFASGLRNCSGVTIRPGTDDLWCVVNERDMLGDDLPPDYATRVTPGAFYGWPWYYIGAHEDPRHKGERPDLEGKITTPDVLIQPHSAPLGLSFYQGAQFPAEFRGDAFVTLHGSWNRASRTGYKIIRLRFKDGKPTGGYEDFITGFVTDDAHVWGRPVDVTAAPDGSLLFTEDGNGTLWRVSFAGK
jgi:glucose/arabinose dehydrogenase